MPKGCVRGESPRIGAHGKAGPGLTRMRTVRRTSALPGPEVEGLPSLHTSLSSLTRGPKPSQTDATGGGSILDARRWVKINCSITEEEADGVTAARRWRDACRWFIGSVSRMGHQYPQPDPFFRPLVTTIPTSDWLPLRRNARSYDPSSRRHSGRRIRTLPPGSYPSRATRGFKMNRTIARSSAKSSAK